MKSWKQNWDAICPIFRFSTEVRKVIYTTNAIESLNATYRKLNRQRSVFPSDTALLKALYLSTFEATKKWNLPLRYWDRFMANSVSCMRGGFLNKSLIYADFLQAVFSPAIDIHQYLLLYIKQGLKAYS